MRQLTIVTRLLAVGTGDFWLVDGTLFFSTLAATMAKLPTVSALGNHAVHRKSSGGKTLKVFLLRLGPAFGHLGTTRGQAVLEGNRVLAVRLALEVNDGMGIRNLLLLQKSQQCGC